MKLAPFTVEPAGEQIQVILPQVSITISTDESTLRTHLQQCALVTNFGPARATVYGKEYELEEAISDYIKLEVVLIRLQREFMFQYLGSKKIQINENFFERDGSLIADTLIAVHRNASITPSVAVGLAASILKISAVEFENKYLSFRVRTNL